MTIVGVGKNKGIPASPAADSAKTAVSKLSTAEKAKQVKKNELFVSPDGKLTKTKKQGSMGVADANRAHFEMWWHQLCCLQIYLNSEV